jgi:CHAT domain-containing protein
LTVNNIKQIAKSQQVTLVKYSLHDDDKLFIWVITPDENIYFRQVNFSHHLASTLIPQFSLTKSLSKTDFKKGVIIVLLVLLLSALLTPNNTQKSTLVSIISLGLLFNLTSCNHQDKLRGNDGHQSPVKREIGESIDINDVSSLNNLIQVTYSMLNPQDAPDIIRSISKKYCENSEECLERLNQILIEPITDLLPNNPNAHVVFIPDGNLFKVPFAALRDVQGQYLIEKHTIRYEPSIKILKTIHEKAKSKSSSSPPVALIVGNPIMPTVKLPAIDEELEEYSVIRNIKPQKLSPLKYAETEVKEIAKLYQTQPLIGQDATGQAVLDKINNADIIHLATHGFYTVTGSSLIALTPTREPCLKKAIECEDRGISYYLEDGFLESGYMFSLGFSQRHNFNGKLKANLVVLSACKTGLAEFTNYRRNSFLNEFIQQGVPSVLVSLWQVPDDSTSELMLDFHRNLQQNPDKAKALRQAMLTTMEKEKYENPSYWSAFVLFGSQ